jgi:O-antigen/teichoic acid export membrane protein
MSHSELQTAPWEIEPTRSTTAAAPEAVESNPVVEESPVETASPTELVADSFAFGVAFMLGLNVVQRVVGLVRNVLVCRMLDPEELGRWNLAFSFLLLAAPLAVLGLPGVFGRYVEYYRHRGALRSFLRRILGTTLVAACAAIALISLAPETIALWVFNDPTQAGLIRMSVAVLALVIGYNILTELLTAMRQVRLVSIMQFSHSFLFACGAIGLLYMTSWGTEAVISAYAVGCAMAIAVALPMLWSTWRKLPSESLPPPASSMWRKLIPFAGWVWATNILCNMYHVADRYMLIHFASVDAKGAAALVGQYHSSRVVPDLMLAVAAMLGGVLLPYLANAWESGERASVWKYMHLALKVISLGFTAGGVVLLLVAPWLFDMVLGGKYHEGLEVMPVTMLYCIWTGLLTIASTYLWCRERPGLGSAALLAGVVINLAMNLLLVPLYGLMGAVIGTAIANASALSLTYCFNARLELPLTRSLWLASAVPLVLVTGPIMSAVLMLVIGLVIWRTSWLLTAEEKATIADGLRGLVGRLPVGRTPRSGSC